MIFWIILKVGTQYAWVFLSVRNNRITELQILEKTWPNTLGKTQSQVYQDKKIGRTCYGNQKQAKHIAENSSTLRAKNKNQLTKIDFKERKVMKAIKKGYSLAELSVVVLIVSMVAYLVVPISWIVVSIYERTIKPSNNKARDVITKYQLFLVHGLCILLSKHKGGIGRWDAIKLSTLLYGKQGAFLFAGGGGFFKAMS